MLETCIWTEAKNGLMKGQHFGGGTLHETIRT